MSNLDTLIRRFAEIDEARDIAPGASIAETVLAGTLEECLSGQFGFILDG